MIYIYCIKMMYFLIYFLSIFVQKCQNCQKMKKIGYFYKKKGCQNENFFKNGHFLIKMKKKMMHHIFLRFQNLHFLINRINFFANFELNLLLFFYVYFFTFGHKIVLKNGLFSPFFMIFKIFICISLLKNTFFMIFKISSKFLWK